MRRLGSSCRVHMQFVLIILMVAASAHSFAQDQPQGKGLDFSLLFDRSGSMSGPENDMALALGQFIVDQAFFFKDDVAALLIPFSTTVHTLPENGYFNAFDPAIAATKSIPPPGGFTDMEAALKVCQKRIAPFDGKREKMAILITDGKPNPNPDDPVRFPEVAQKVRQQCGKFAPGSPNYINCLIPFAAPLGKKSEENIIGTLMPAFGDSLPLYAIGLTNDDINREFLANCSRISTHRSDAFKIVTRENLIDAANSIFPKGANVINIYSNRIDKHQAQPVSDPFRLPLALKRVRFVINYLDGGIKEKDMQVEIRLPDGSALGRGSQGGSHLVATTQGNNPSLVFERFILPTPVPSGDGQVMIQRTGGVTLPRMLIVAEGVISDGQFKITLTPGEPEAGENLVVDAKVEERGNIIPAEKISGAIHTPDGRATPISLNRNADGSFSGTYSIPKGIQGKHLLALSAILDSKLNQTISGEQIFHVRPSGPVKLRFEIPYGGGQQQSRAEEFTAPPQSPLSGLFVSDALAQTPPQDSGRSQPQDSKRPDMLTYPEIGCEKRDFTIRGIRILNDSSTTANITVRATPLTSGSGVVLDSKDWLKVTPAMTGIANKNAPFIFNAIVSIPKSLPGDLENATYRGEIIVECPQGNSLTIPVEIPVHVPSFSGLPPRLTFRAFWTTPCTRSASITVQADGNCPIKGRVIADCDFLDRKEDYVSANRLRLTSDNPSFEIADGRSSRVGLTAIMGNLEAGRYTSEVYVDGDITRDVSVPVDVIIPPPAWPPWPYRGPGYRGNVLQVLHLLGGAILLLGIIRSIAAARMSGYRIGSSWSGDTSSSLTIHDPEEGAPFFTVASDGTGGWVLTPGSMKEVLVNDLPVFSSTIITESSDIQVGGFGFSAVVTNPFAIQLQTTESPIDEGYFRRPAQLMTAGAVFLIAAQGLTWFA